MHRLTSAVAALIAIAACTGDSATTSTVVDETTAPESTQPLPTDVSVLPGRLVVVDDNFNVVTMNPDGSDPAAITDDGGNAAGYRQPAFSPAADTLAWSEINADGSGLGSSDPRGEGRVSVPMTAPPFYLFWSPDGNGIGLSLVYRIIQLHDGAIEVESEVGRGTSMIVRLPVRSGA